MAKLLKQKKLPDIPSAKMAVSSEVFLKCDLLFSFSSSLIALLRAKTFPIFLKIHTKNALGTLLP